MQKLAKSDKKWQKQVEIGKKRQKVLKVAKWQKVAKSGKSGKSDQSGRSRKKWQIVVMV